MGLVSIARETGNTYITVIRHRQKQKKKEKKKYSNRNGFREFETVK